MIFVLLAVAHIFKITFRYFPKLALKNCAKLNRWSFSPLWLPSYSMVAVHFGVIFEKIQKLVHVDLCTVHNYNYHSCS